MATSIAPADALGAPADELRREFTFRSTFALAFPRRPRWARTAPAHRDLHGAQLVVCGYLADVCVHYTCVDAHQHDLRLVLARDACAGSSTEAADAAFAAVEYLQHGSVVETKGLLGVACDEH